MRVREGLETLYLRRGLPLSLVAFITFCPSSLFCPRRPYLPGKPFSVNTCVDCLDAGRVSVQAPLGWWNNPGWVQRLFLHSVMFPPREHSTRNSVEVSPQGQHAGSAGVNKGPESSPSAPLLRHVLHMPRGTSRLGRPLPANNDISMKTARARAARRREALSCKSRATSVRAVRPLIKSGFAIISLLWRHQQCELATCRDSLTLSCACKRYHIFSPLHAKPCLLNLF